MTLDLFNNDPDFSYVRLADGAVLLRGFALSAEDEVLTAIQEINSRAAFRHMITPGGFKMSVAMTSCGTFGWVTDRKGYRYDTHDPLSGAPWPPMPDDFIKLAISAAEAAGFQHFAPDACLINRYAEGAKLSLHQDKDEKDLQAPVVSVSLGLPATFLFGGLKRTDKTCRILLSHGDVVVWGGPARLFYHGVMPLKKGYHPLLGPYRINLTFRKMK